ncbi:hypothetical protein BBW65_05485 [Helicobacter enhydrae]|uniref:Periplasmic protein n=1 Tax=Helicobacter enhydrae TaxID=222136 RepID=A0A1B1U673_9HELI|nr:hypothetical protein [Helicobacter enhydrae]ANV98283.1 hypothetical protein BBW65_05485 [Helicobacter enhydrae]
MKIRHYFIAGLAFIVFVGLCAYFIYPEDLSIHIWGMQSELTLPLAVWIIITLGVFFVLTLLFLTTNSIATQIHSYRGKKDFEHLLTQIQNQMLDINHSDLSFKLPAYQTLSKALQRCHITPILTSPESGNAKFDHLIKDLEQISNGVFLKTNIQYPKDTHFWNLNTQNKIASDLKFAREVLNGDYQETLQEKALDTLFHSQLDAKAIQKITASEYSPTITQKLIAHLLEGGFKIPLDQLQKLILKAKFSTQAMIALLGKLNTNYPPDSCLHLLENLAPHSPNIKVAYVYLLLEYSMFQKAQEYLHTEECEELLWAQAFLDLKEANKHYPLSLFFKFS